MLLQNAHDRIMVPTDPYLDTHGLGSCPMAGFGISSVKSLAPANKRVSFVYYSSKNHHYPFIHAKKTVTNYYFV
jgi:hypothetical protein